MSFRTIKVLDAASLVRRNVLVLELDIPNPIVGVTVGMPVDIVFAGGGKERVTLKGLGFASSTPDHAHVIVAAPTSDRDLADIVRIELDLPTAADE